MKFNDFLILRPEGANHSFGIKTCSQNNLSCTLCDSISPPASLSASFVPLRLSLGVAEKDWDMDAGTVSREALASEGKCLSEGVDEETFESIDLSDFSDLSQVEDEDTSEDEKVSDYLSVHDLNAPKPHQQAKLRRP